jgi:dipeptidyl aminopeptidase/acylaminoacyl peptidase
MKIATDWSRDGRYVLYRVQKETRSDLWVLPLTGGNGPYPLIETRFDEREGQFSPDGHWVAYQSDESGRYQVYLQPFPGPGERIPVTVDGGTQPRWRPDGRELFYLSPDEKLVAVPIVLKGSGPPQLSPPVALFQTQISGGAVPGANRQQYDVSPDSHRFLMSVSVVDGDIPPISMVLHWKPTSSQSSPR